jgi:Protein of unknown function (DUF2909)
LRILVYLLIALILFSLGSALFYLVKDKGQGDRAVRALTFRIGLSISLFVILMLSYYLGLIPARGL